MEELSFGGVVRKKWRDITHSHVHYPTNSQTPRSKKVFSPKWRKRKGIFLVWSSIVFQISNGGVVRWKSCAKMVWTYSSFQIMLPYKFL